MTMQLEQQLPMMSTTMTCQLGAVIVVNRNIVARDNRIAS